MNKVILCGRLARDPEVRYSQGATQTCIARYSLAVDRRMQRQEGSDEPTADFINCVAFGRAGEFAERYLKKGTKIMVVGRIQTGSYTDRDGKRIYTTDVIIEEQEFAESKSASRQAQEEGSSAPSAPARTDSEGFMHIPDGVTDEGLPFN